MIRLRSYLFFAVIFIMPALTLAAQKNAEEHLQIACLTDAWRGIQCTPDDLQATARLVQSVGLNQERAGLISLFCDAHAFDKRETFAHCIDTQLELLKTHPLPDDSQFSPEISLNARRYCSQLWNSYNQDLARYFDCMAKSVSQPELVTPEHLKKEYEAHSAAPAPKLVGPSLKGHRLGETTAMFMSAAPVFKRYLAQCRLQTQDSEKPDDVMSRLLSASGLEVSSHCTDALKLARIPRASARIVRGLDTDIGLATGAAFATAFGATDEFNKDLNKTSDLPLDFSGAIQFDQGLAVYIEVRMSTNWEDSKRDLYNKFGKPSRISSVTVQNDYGARNELADAYWEHPDYVVHAFENIFKQSRFVTVELLTREFYEKIQKKQDSRPNSLD